jgi:hypothetical protein
MRLMPAPGAKGGSAVDRGIGGGGNDSGVAVTELVTNGAVSGDRRRTMIRAAVVSSDSLVRRIA